MLHDVGHVPLGHTLEDEFDGLYKKHDSFDSPRLGYLWQSTEIAKLLKSKSLYPQSIIDLKVDEELIYNTVMIICLYKRKDGKDFGRLLQEKGGAFPTVLLGAYNCAIKEHMYIPYMTDIVSDTICADYLDYLQRDPSNVGLDVLRDDRVTTSFYIGKTSDGIPRMALALRDRNNKPRLDVATAVVDLVRQRYRFAEIIYYHKTKVAASAMLAKAFTYLQTPAELPKTEGRHVRLGNIDELAEKFIQFDASERKKFCENMTPSAMLDLEVGDESLLMLLLQDGIRLLQANRSRDQLFVKRILTGICLVQMIWKRNLYKVTCTISADNYSSLHTGSKIPEEVEGHIAKTLGRFRKDADKRDNLERKMSVAARFPEGSLILYVPERKSQAKGIETGAFSSGVVVQLDKHGIVKDEVETLGEKYKKLWRIIVLVHPDYRNEHRALSRAIDALLEEIWPPPKDNNSDSNLNAIIDVCWFNYVPEKREASAELYIKLRKELGLDIDSLDWSLFVSVPEQTVIPGDTVESNEYAFRAVLFDLTTGKVQGAVDKIRLFFPKPGKLRERMDEILGEKGLNDDSQNWIRALREIAESLEGTLPGLGNI